MNAGSGVLRRSRRLSTRDLRALSFVGEGYEIAQYHLRVVFGDRSPTVASRFVGRAVSRGLVVAERIQGIGMNRLRLTARGCEVVAGAGHPTDHMFVPRRATAPKDLPHTLRINDLRAAFAMRKHPPTELFPAWALQRMFWAEVIPDLLAVWRNSGGQPTLTLASEIDLGTERLKTVFLPKLAKLGRVLRERSGKDAAILVLTEGERRADLVREFASRELPLTMVVETMPKVFGADGLTELRTRLSA